MCAGVKPGEWGTGVVLFSQKRLLHIVIQRASLGKNRTAIKILFLSVHAHDVSPCTSLYQSLMHACKVDYQFSRGIIHIK